MTRINVYREETVERRWECPHCHAYGVVSMRAHGESGWRRTWFSREMAETQASEDARWDVQRDAERMMGMMRCPSCDARAPRAVMWSIARSVAPIVVGLLMALTVAAIVWVSVPQLPWFVLAPVLLGGALWFGLADEARRWRTARKTEIQSLRPGTPQLPVAVARILPPSAPPKVLEPLAAKAPVIVEAADTADGPRFLKER